MAIKPENFFSDEDKIAIQEAIDSAERTSSGRIRLHVEKRAGKDPLSRVRAVFDSYSLRDSINRNNVIIYVSVLDKKVIVFADDGLAAVIPDTFLQDTAEGIAEGFKLGEYGQAITGAVRSISAIMTPGFPAGEGKKDILGGVSFE